MNPSESERLAKVILESSRERKQSLQILPLQLSEAKANEEKLRQAKRQFDKKYSISTPPELLGI